MSKMNNLETNGSAAESRNDTSWVVDQFCKNKPVVAAIYAN